METVVYGQTLIKMLKPIDPELSSRPGSEA
jgi:hypothetical protein